MGSADLRHTLRVSNRCCMCCTAAVIMHFRKTAHMKVEKQKRLAAVKKREQQIASGEGRGWFSFMGWSPGGGGSGNKATAEALPSKLDLETEFNEDEMAQMEAVAAEQKRLMEEAKKWVIQLCHACTGLNC